MNVDPLIMAMPASLESLKAALPENGLFGETGWRWSPEPMRLTAKEAREMIAMGYPLAKFQQACDLLYRRSAQGRELPWLAELLDAGKPSWMVDVQRHSAMANQFPRVIRFGGCLATLVPADKKKIQRMSGGILVPCIIEE